MNEKAINRVKRMEDILDSHEKTVNNLIKALRAYKKSQKSYLELREYYDGEEWFEDIEAYEKGDIPKDSKCGVLSEDAVFNLIGDNIDAAIEMLEVATKVIKAH